MEKPDLLVYVQKLQMSLEQEKAKDEKKGHLEADVRKFKEELVHANIALQHARNELKESKEESEKVKDECLQLKQAKEEALQKTEVGLLTVWGLIVVSIFAGDEDEGD